MAPEASDGERLNVAGGDFEGFFESIEPHFAKMGRVAARIAGVTERDDVVQEALLSAWKHRRQYNPRRGTVSAWLLAITAHEAMRTARREARGAGHRQPSDHVTSPDILDLQSAIARLTPRERLAVDCYYFAGLSVLETAAVMQCSEGTVKSTLADARTRLRLALR